MTNKVFKIVAASFSLLLYLSTMVASDIAILTCGCTEPIAHLEQHNHCSDHEGCCCHSDYDSCEYDFNAVTLESDNCSCQHDHTNKVELYTSPRLADDDSSLRLSVLFVALLGDASRAEGCKAQAKTYHYGDYLLPPLSAAALGSLSLRAPPALV
jgi:hypothetical protein